METVKAVYDFVVMWITNGGLWPKKPKPKSKEKCKIESEKCKKDCKCRCQR